MAKQKNVSVQEVTHAEEQKKETFGEGVVLPQTSTATEYAAIDQDVDLDHVVTVPDLSSGPGHRVQVQGVDAPPPAVNSLAQGQGIAPEFVNGVPPTQAQIDAERRAWVDINGNPVVSE